MKERKKYTKKEVIEKRISFKPMLKEQFEKLYDHFKPDNFICWEPSYFYRFYYSTTNGKSCARKCDSYLDAHVSIASSKEISFEEFDFEDDKMTDKNKKVKTIRDLRLGDKIFYCCIVNEDLVEKEVVSISINKKKSQEKPRVIVQIDGSEGIIPFFNMDSTCDYSSIVPSTYYLNKGEALNGMIALLERVAKMKEDESMRHLNERNRLREVQESLKLKYKEKDEDSDRFKVW